MTFYSWLRETIPSNSIIKPSYIPSSVTNDNLVISRIINKAIADFAIEDYIDSKLEDAINKAVPALSDEELEEILKGETN